MAFPFVVAIFAHQRAVAFTWAHARSLTSESANATVHSALRGRVRARARLRVWRRSERNCHVRGTHARTHARTFSISQSFPSARKPSSRQPKQRPPAGVLIRRVASSIFRRRGTLPSLPRRSRSSLGRVNPPLVIAPPCVSRSKRFFALRRRFDRYTDLFFRVARMARYNSARTVTQICAEARGLPLS